MDHVKGMWMVGPPRQHFPRGCLPSGRNVLQVMWFHMKEEGKNLSASSNIVSKSLLQMWFGYCSTKRDNNVSRQIKVLYGRWQTLFKSSKRDSPKTRTDRQIFSDVLDEIFDVSSLHQLNIQSKKVTKKPNCLASLSLKGKADLREYSNVVSHVETEQVATTEKVGDEASVADPDYRPPSKKVKLNQVVTSDLAQTMDRTQLSLRKSMEIMCKSAIVFKRPVATLALSKSTIQRQRAKVSIFAID